MQPERRKHVRILTIANFGRALVVLLIILAAANVISELRAPRHGEYGRLISREEPRDVAMKRLPPVVEAPVAEAPVTPAVTSLVDAPAAQDVAPAQVVTPPKPSPAVAVAVGDHVTIVGGADGIRVETTRHDAAPKLSGGIFRQ
ncbi:MAG TPA: hypothetical protein VF381_09360 [Thermoanaerobaculia bacterium]